MSNDTHFSALRVEALTFRHGRRPPILDGLSFSAPRGATALLGPNGAGKSTLLRALATASAVESGAVRLERASGAFGFDRLRAFRRAVAWLPQDVAVFPGLRVRQHVAYDGWLKGLSRGAAWEAAQPALERVGLWELRDEAATRLSGGQRRRLGIAGALVHEAEVLLLDEPTAGLDPRQRSRFREILAEVAETKIVLVSTHLTDDIDEVFETIVLLTDGAIAFEGSVESFLSPFDSTQTRRERLDAAYASFVRREE